MINQAIKKIFEKHILSAHYEIKKNGKEYFPLKGDMSYASYYEDPIHKEYAIFSQINTGGKEDISKYMNDIFISSGTPEFSALAQEIGRLATDLKQTEKEQSSELSPFVYVMY